MMSLIKVEDIAYIRFGAPNLQKMKSFLRDFGLQPAEEVGDGVLRMRGAGPEPFIHETERGEAAFKAIGLKASSIDDLKLISNRHNVAVEPSTKPGGGFLVRVCDPNGIDVEVVAGQTPATPTEVSLRASWNSHYAVGRRGEAKRVGSGPSGVTRLGHAVFLVSDVGETNDWWSDNFGFLMSDRVLAPDGALAAVFIRCDRGEIPTDHHTLNFASVPSGKTGFHHAAFEVRDFDDLVTGSEYLKKKGYEQIWGIGRHLLGSQVFDYWSDPFGHFVEHWTDGDVFNASDAAAEVELAAMVDTQWGPPISPTFI